MIFRPATLLGHDFTQVLRLYREFLASEPCSVLLNITDCHLEARPGILCSLTNLIKSGNVLLCFREDSEEALGMGIYYSKKCHPDELTARAEIETLTRAEGYPELESIMCLSAAAVDSPRLSSVYNIDQYQYLELVVTAPAARGLGVATGIIKHVQNLVSGVLVCVATSPGTAIILSRLGWKLWNCIQTETFLYQNFPIFQHLSMKSIPAYVTNTVKANTLFES